MKVSETVKLEMRKHGQDFLWKDFTEWPQQPTDLCQELSDQDEEVKKESITVNPCAEKEVKYSKWEKLRRVVAWVVRAAHMLFLDGEWFLVKGSERS